MATHFTASMVLVTTLFVGVAHADDAKETADGAISPATKRLGEIWLRTCLTAKPGPGIFDKEDVAHGAALQELLAQSDADLWLTQNIFDSDKTQHVFGDPSQWVAVEQVVKLNSQRTFDMFVKRLQTTDWGVRQRTVGILGRYQRSECRKILIDLLEHDPERQVRVSAANALAKFQDADGESALIRAVDGNDKRVAIAAATALGTLNSDAGIDHVVRLVQATNGAKELKYLIWELCGYRKKEVFEAILSKVEHSPPPIDDLLEQLDINALNLWGNCDADIYQVLGPKPDELLPEWLAWWKHAEPLLNDDLRLKQPPEEPKKYGDREFGHLPQDLELQIAVDCDEYRLCDPIRLDLIFRNNSDKPYRVVLPKPPSTWNPTMAYGIRLTRGNKTEVDFEPSDYYFLSYAGPPEFETLGPRQTFRSSICLQYFLDRRIKRPLPEGDYELMLTFDSGKFPGIESEGTGLVSAWSAKPVKFKIQGAEQANPDEVLQLIAQTTGLPFLKDDLKSKNFYRSVPAQQAILQYGDDRLDSHAIKPVKISELRSFLRGD